ncbi:hypothetical protein BSLG_006062 [Batrachochytrium salamandrivorans]|nr:hypothetical protein BSLG_006062 [Batrachochytrium salamandrivorans]
MSTQTAIRPSGEYYHGYYINAHDGGPSEYLKYTYGLTQAEIRHKRAQAYRHMTPWVWQLEEVSLDALDRRKQFLADNPTEGLGTWAESKDASRKNKTTGRIRGPSAVPTGSDRRRSGVEDTFDIALRKQASSQLQQSRGRCWIH